MGGKGGGKVWEDGMIGWKLANYKLFLFVRLHRDREWQKWPVTIVTGAYLGFFVGTLAGGYLLRGKRIKFE